MCIVLLCSTGNWEPQLEHQLTNRQFSVSGTLLTTPLIYFQCILSNEKVFDSSSEVQRQRWQKTTSCICFWGQISCWTFFSHLAQSKRQKNRDIIDLPLFKFNYLSPNLSSTWAEHYLTMQKVPAASLVLAKKRKTLNNLYLVSDFSFLMHF